MKFLENYKSVKDEVFAIFVKENLEPLKGDFEGLYFQVVPALNKENRWNCVIQISGTLQAVWGLGRNNNLKDVYEILEKLGALKIKQAIEKEEQFLDFMFTTFTAEQSWQKERDKLLAEFKKGIFKVKKSKEVKLAEIINHNKELRWKVLRTFYELSEGNVWNFIMHEDVAKKLEMEPRDNFLHGIYKFLTDKGFLKPETNVEYSITSAGLEEVEENFPILLKSMQFSSFYEASLKISIDDIDSFNKVKNVPTGEIVNLFPLNFSEDNIQNWFEEIIGEPEHKKDWGGEINDLFTTQLLLNNSRKNTAILLKGPGISTKTLDISHCGKKGDQIQRLFKSPAELFIIQFVGLISENVIEEAKSKTLLLRHEGVNAQFCIIDGYDTARILKAYGKI